MRAMEMKQCWSIYCLKSNTVVVPAVKYKL